MFLALIQSDVEKYGVFAAMVAVAGMIVAAVAALARLWRGPLKGWEIPEQPFFASRLVTLPSAFLMVFGFFYSTPDKEWFVLILGGLLTLAAVITGVAYASKTMRFRRFREEVAGDGVTTKIPVLAGDELTPWARRVMQEKNLTEQQCFAGTPNQPYEADQMWLPNSRVRVYKQMMILFIVALFCGTGALSWLAYAVEVRVTGKPASAILNPSQIPSRDPGQPK
jgi:hypothetical protein